MVINKRKLLKEICCFFIMFYIFNISIVGKIFRSETLATLTLLISMFFLILCGKIKKINKYQLYTLIVIIIAIVLELFNNFYIIENRLGVVLKYTIMLLLPFVILVNEDVVEISIKYLKIFCFEHIIGTMIVQIFSGFYINSLLPWMSNGEYWMAKDNFLQGYNPGLTSHYSMNGMYLSIAIIYFFALAITKKEKKYILYTIFALIAILFNAKRGPLLFSAMSCCVLYLWYNKSKIASKVFKGGIIVILGIIIALILSLFVPQILTVVKRFEDGIATGNILNGRQDFYELAKEMWEQNKLLGNGWGSFSYNFQTKIYNVGYGVEYMDAHNVYLQLLCEVGILGFLFYIVIMFFALKITLSLIHKSKDSQTTKQLCFSLGYQIFFLLYCFTGNPLYDIQCYAIYFICIGIAISNYIKEKKQITQR